MKRIITFLSVPTFLVPLVFLGIGYVIKSPQSLDSGKERMDLSFLRTIRPSDLNERERKKPKAPPKVQKQPNTPKPKVAKVSKPKSSNMKMQAIPLNLALDVGGGPFIGGVGAAQATGSGDSDIVPIVKVNPQYPREAAMRGLEGWVQLEIDIGADGSVTGAKVTNSNPRRVFDSSARRAAMKYKYKPQVKDGKPYALKGHLIQLDFKLEDDF